jgi:hypothetical protein
MAIRFYLVTEFIIYPKKSAARPKNAGKSKDIAMPSLAVPDLSTDPSSGTSTPPTTVEEIKVSALRARPPREDGGLVCCLAISEYCFKMGRVTIPPVHALAPSRQDVPLMNCHFSESQFNSACSPRPRTDKIGRGSRL